MILQGVFLFHSIELVILLSARLKCPASLPRFTNTSLLSLLSNSTKQIQLKLHTATLLPSLWTTGASSYQSQTLGYLLFGLADSKFFSIIKCILATCSVKIINFLSL